MARGLGRAYDGIELLLRRRRIIRVKDLREAGISSAWLPMAELFGWLRRHETGVFVEQYLAPALEFCAAIRWPNAAFTGLTTLSLFGFCEPPPTLWLAIDHRSRAPARTVPAIDEEVAPNDPSSRSVSSTVVPSGAMSSRVELPLPEASKSD